MEKTLRKSNLHEQISQGESLVTENGGTFQIVHNVEDFLLRRHVSKSLWHEYTVHCPAYFGRIRELLSTWVNRAELPKLPHGKVKRILASNPAYITEFRTQKLWNWEPGVVPISHWENCIIRVNVDPGIYRGDSPDRAMCNAWVDYLLQDRCPSIRWVPGFAPLFDRLMQLLKDSDITQQWERDGGFTSATWERSYSKRLAEFVRVVLTLMESAIDEADLVRMESVALAGLAEVFEPTERDDAETVATSWLLRFGHVDST